MIYVIQRELPHYRIPFFLELSKLADIKVLYCKSSFDTANTKVAGRYQDACKDDIFHRVKGLFPTLNPYVSYLCTTWLIIKDRPSIIIHEMSLSIINVYFIPLIAKLLNIKLIWWGHGYNRFDKTGNLILKRKLRILLHRSSKASIVYSQKGKLFLTEFGIDPKKIFVAWNTTDTKEFERCSLLNIPALSKEIKNPEGNREISFVYIARLIKEKKPLFVAELFLRLAVKYSRCKFHIIGSGPEENYLNRLLASRRYENIYFHGAITDTRIIATILSSCDAMISPGYLGLNIIDALANGIPVIAVKDGISGVFHSPEIEYIENEEAFIDAGDLSLDAFESCCSSLIENRDKLERAKLSAQNCFKKISMTKMLSGFKCAIEYVT
ncbi:MAG: glycosyltransferase family 4 protein [Bacteroidota bacterium]|nr:glycosyltransferase family 4 protein [Bacteroidota bacterium]MDP4190810.1 glycosyltransferase family 4 protein [Bacteroidota bacterium]MDP4196792.1 glycosyltransferase family 4 protein [Bacteroidota bacterium]